MNKTTQELMNAANTLVQFQNNFPYIRCEDTKEDIDLLQSYLNYELKKILKDIIHVERL